MWPDLRDEIHLELSQLQQLFDTFDALRCTVCVTPPSKVEIVALAGFLHSFYTGIENICKRISLCFGDRIPDASIWHTLLLDAMTHPGTGRPAVLSTQLKDLLRDYLNFRHVFRHAYPHELPWSKMAPLVIAWSLQ